jgi:serine phosphatase RsbU (regulator of sigma subunit)
VNAGHEPLLIYHAKDKSVEEIRGVGMALGMLPDNSKIVKEMTVNFDVGDTLVMYSDGLPECWKDEKECYGMERLKKLVSDYGTMPSALAIRNGILSEIKQYAGGYKQMDDMTIIVVKRKM